jgi:hypothetical protein
MDDSENKNEFMLFIRSIFPVIKVIYILWFYTLFSRTLSRPEDPLEAEELEPNN